MSTYSTSLGLEEITPGDQAGLWGNTTNTNLSLIDQAIAGVTPVNLGSASGSTYVLTYYNGAVDESRSAVIKITGTATGPNIIQIPQSQKLYVIFNNSGNTVTVQTSLAVNTVTLADGESTLVFCDGFNAYPGIKTAGAGTVTVPYGGTGVTTFGAGFIVSPGGTANLISVPYIPLGASSAAVSGVLPVPNGGTGLSSITSGALLQGNGTGNVSPLVGGSSGQVATWNGSQWIAATPTSGTGTVTSVTGTGTVNGLTLSGTVISTGNLTLGGTLSGTASDLTAGGLTGTPAITVASVTSSGTVSAYSGTNYAALQGGSVALYNTTTGMFADGSKFGFQANGSSMCFIYNGTGSIQNVSGSYTAISDSRIKENVTPARSYLADLQKLNVVNYNLIGRNEKYLGLVAQDVQAVMPGLVDTEEKNEAFPDVPNLLSVKYSILVPMLLQAVQELKAEIDILKSK